MESDYDYWWRNTTEIIKKHVENGKSLFAKRAKDDLLKCAKNQ